MQRVREICKYKYVYIYIYVYAYVGRVHYICGEHERSHKADTYVYIYIYIHKQYTGRCDLTGTIGHVCNWHGDVLLFPEHPQHIHNPSKMNK